MDYKKIACTAVGVVGGAISTFFGGWKQHGNDASGGKSKIRKHQERNQHF